MRCLFYANLSSELMPPVCAADLCIHARVPASVQYVCPRACVCVCVCVCAGQTDVCAISR